MIVLFALAMVLTTLFVVATSHVILAQAGKLERQDTFFRENSGEIGAQSNTDAVNIDISPSSEFQTAAATINAPDIAAFKRALDIGLSLGLVVFLAPLLLMTAIAVKLESKGPVLYRQKRVGYGGQVFEVFKFRSMIVDAEANGPQYAAVKDKRITRVGRFIRKFRIDEIPQTINVLRGEMSFVGPRPERPEFVLELEQEIPLYHCRHLVKPGITGWAQVKYEYAASVEGARNKLRYDLYYIRHFSPALDLMIVLMTVRVALFGLGSR